MRKVYEGDRKRGAEKSYQPDFVPTERYRGDGMRSTEVRNDHEEALFRHRVQGVKAQYRLARGVQIDDF